VQSILPAYLKEVVQNNPNAKELIEQAYKLRSQKNKNKHTRAFAKDYDLLFYTVGKSTVIKDPNTFVAKVMALEAIYQAKTAPVEQQAAPVEQQAAPVEQQAARTEEDDNEEDDNEEDDNEEDDNEEDDKTSTAPVAAPLPAAGKGKAAASDKGKAADEEDDDDEGDEGPGRKRKGQSRDVPGLTHSWTTKRHNEDRWPLKERKRPRWTTKKQRSMR
jgi:hypothetical protein